MQRDPVIVTVSYNHILPNVILKTDHSEIPVSLYDAGGSNGTFSKAMLIIGVN